MKEFVVALEQEVESENEDGGIPFVIKGPGKEKRTLVAQYPGEGQIVMLMAANGRRSGVTDRVAGIIDFFMGVLDEADFHYIEQRLMDRTDPFGAAEIEAIMRYLVEEWGGRPTKQPSDFASSQKSTGRKSTRPTSKSA